MTKIGRFRKLLNEAVEIAKTYGFDITFEQVMERWSEPHRFWHVPTHLYEMLEGIKELYKEKKINDREYNILVIAAIFHDIVYDTKRNDNEEKSVEFMLSKYKPELVDIKVNISQWRVDEDIKKIVEVIMGTKTHESTEGLTKKFNKLDTSILDAQFIDMLDWENKIYKEYKWVGWKEYKKGRIKFLLSQIKGHTYNALNIKNLIDYVTNKVPKTGIIYYDIDKLPTIDEFIENNKKVNNLFDNVMILIVYNSNNYNKEKIKEYGICSDGNNEFFALMEDSVPGFINKQTGDVTIVKELKYMDKYNNKALDQQLSTKLGDFRVIYI